MLAQAFTEFIVLLGFGAAMFLFGALLFANPTMFAKWDLYLLRNYRGYKKKKLPRLYGRRQQLGALITMGFGVILLLSAYYTIVIYS